MRPRRGFKLIELMLVLALGLVSFGLFCGCAEQARKFNDTRDTQGSLKFLAQACRLAEIEYGRLPHVYGAYGRPLENGQGRIGTTFVHMLPFLEQNALFREGNFDRAAVKVFISSLDDSIEHNQVRYTSFVANLRIFSSVGAGHQWNQPIGDLAACREGSLSTQKIWDGATNTVLFTTKYGVCNGTPNYFDQAPDRTRKGAPFFGAGNHQHGGAPSTHIAVGRLQNVPPYQINPRRTGAGADACNDDAGLYGHSYGSFGLIVAMGDASVRTLSQAVSGDTWGKAICPNDGLALGVDW